jgi:hypothetical protein
MRSPLPDSSNLEAGILEDTVPSRLSRVHDNVRDLLRQSVFGAFHVSPTPSPTNGSPPIRVLPSPVPKLEPRRGLRPESPAEATPVSLHGDVPGVLFPAWRRDHCSPPVHIDTAGHPDVSPNAMSVFMNLQQTEAQRSKPRQQHKAWTRPKSRRSTKRNSNTQWAVCIILGFAMFGLLGACKAYIGIHHDTGKADRPSDIALATTSAHVAPILHVLFILALLLTSIVFAHTLVRLSCLRGRNKQRVVRIEPAPRRRRHRNHPDEEAAPAASTNVAGHFVPQTPIPVQGPDLDELNSTNHSASPEMYEIGDKGAQVLNPPPAYGSMTSSVRADPDLLYWRVVPSPVEGGMPSPTYDQVMRESGIIGQTMSEDRQSARERQ